MTRRSVIRSLIRQRIISGVLLVVAVVGWAFILIALGRVSDLSDSLAPAEADLSKTRADLSKVSEELTAAREDLLRLQEAVSNREELIKQVESHQAELVFLRAQINDSKAELDKVHSEVRQRQEWLSGTAPTKYVTTTRARVRAEPSTESKELALVAAGVPLQVFEVVKDGMWYKVGSIGFMYHELLEPRPSTGSQ